ncbi:hypothetical protein EU510_00500 [Pseudoalteromonas sp. FUC4]|uniref:Uncharacterized protein n=1 Tax=Pseudoalteromonas distincta TaxID=77608 RepID=A0A4V1HDV0_9GAMM|nr:hypothetical protein EU510_00500 [Pseudoalteromonas sp. FUC4]KAA1162464.1 hypothetical protein EU511_04790 [Pseudoalteromonas distincta]QCU76045.1 hypothetical protein FFU37_03560 [Pseudoalteromonas distincta]TVU75708.1 hypothetical protein FQP81_09790 [Pseudoalteromonas elyakovii]
MNAYDAVLLKQYINR